MPHIPHRKSGQALLFLIAVLLIGTVVVLCNLNVHRMIITKLRLRDAGDSAALMGARWQGISLNMIGELNLVQAVLASEAIAQIEADNDPEYLNFDWYRWIAELEPELAGIQDVQRRLRGQGPLVGFSAGQQMILNNRIYADASYGEAYGNIADWIYLVSENVSDEVGEDFAVTLGSVADNGVAAKTITARQYHILWDAGFYDAILAGLAGNWCQFYLNSTYESWLNTYSSPGDWPDLPDDAGYSILGLDLETATWPLQLVVQSWETNANDFSGHYTEYVDYLEEAEEDILDDIVATHKHYSEIPIKWTLFGSSWYNSWSDFARSNSLPFRGNFVAHFDYMGPESIFEINIRNGTSFQGTDQGTDSLVERKEEGDGFEFYSMDEYNDLAINRDDKTSRKLRWISAAKTFGALDLGSESYTPAYFRIVLPCFDNVRLIPVQRHIPETITNPDTDFEHYYYHIPRYIENDDVSELDPDHCILCRILMQFEDASFRQEGQDWIADPDNTEHCIEYGGGGGGGSGAPAGH